MDERLLSYLREQVRFLRSSAKAYDDGDEAEERRLATAIRVLVHDTGQSHSLLGQLGLKERLHWTDTRLRLPRDAGHILHTGLCLASMRDGDSRFTPVFHRLSPEGSGHRVAFSEWWTGEVLPDDRGDGSFTRKRFALRTANTTGGAHVDPAMDQTLARLIEHGLQSTITYGSGPSNDATLASVRQIAWEVLTTIEEEIGHLIDPNALDPHKPLPGATAARDGSQRPLPVRKRAQVQRCHGT